jgi:hypothetical protein
MYCLIHFELLVVVDRTVAFPACPCRHSRRPSGCQMLQSAHSDLVDPKGLCFFHYNTFCPSIFFTSFFFEQANQDIGRKLSGLLAPRAGWSVSLRVPPHRVSHERRRSAGPTVYFSPANCRHFRTLPAALALRRSAAKKGTTPELEAEPAPLKPAAERAGGAFLLYEYIYSLKWWRLRGARIRSFMSSIHGIPIFWSSPHGGPKKTGQVQ